MMWGWGWWMGVGVVVWVGVSQAVVSPPQPSNKVSCMLLGTDQDYAEMMEMEVYPSPG